MAVVVCGSANVDLVISAPRFPRPGETLLGDDFEQLFGGKGANQAVAAALLGSRVRMVARVGADSLGDATIANFERLGVDAARVRKTSDKATGVALITVDETGENTIVVASGANGALSEADATDATARARRAGTAAAATRTRRGDESRRRRGRDVDIPWSRGDAAAATRTFHGVAATPRPRRGHSMESRRRRGCGRFAERSRLPRPFV